jgi:glycosyltransferase involved in cell wall biosynthesis
MDTCSVGRLVMSWLQGSFRYARPQVGARRLGLYIDTIYRVSEDDGVRRVLTISQCYQFLRFACAVGDHFDSLVLFGRQAAPDLATEFVLPREGTVDLAPLPYYANLRQARQVLRAVFGVVRGMWRGLDKVDTVWVFGPYPFSLVLVACALLRRKRVVLGVRQDTMRYYRSRLANRWMAPVLALLWIIDLLYRRLSRWLPTTVVGGEIERRYGGPRENLLRHVVSVVPSADLARSPREPESLDEVRLLTVGRIDREKTPLMLVECLAELHQTRPGRYRLTWAGAGPLAVPMQERARVLGVNELLHLPGYVPFGPGLLALYRGAHVFVHSSLTEGAPQVLIEAMATALPIVATNVGGVAELLGDAAGRLVPPDDPSALVDAVLTLSDDPVLRQRSSERGLMRARDYTLEAQSSRVGRFIAGVG